MSAYAPVDDMDGKSLAEVLRELAWTRRQRNDGIAARTSHAKARGEAEHRRSKAERALADARRSFRGALDALNSNRTITTEEELDTLPCGSVVLSAIYIANHGQAISFQRWEDGDWHRGARSSNTHPDNFLPVTVLHIPEATL